MFIGGASSIDKAMRTEGMNWWPDEQCSQEELASLYALYKEHKPDVMVTHEAPHRVARSLFNVRGWEWSDTRFHFDQMIEAHHPKLWIFGHWHENRNIIYEGTRMVCLAPLATIDVDLEKELTDDQNINPS